jgi:hypothetical protein
VLFPKLNPEPLDVDPPVPPMLKGLGLAASPPLAGVEVFPELDPKENDVPVLG